jgi:hypothetical protein
MDMIFSRAHAVYGLALVVSVATLRADLANNPYASITDRNPFGLKDPPPPPQPQTETAPATPPAKVTLTGLISMFGQPQALLEIFDEPGKAGTPKKPILREGERMGAVEVLAINVEKNTVTIRNSGQETNLTFEVAKSGAAPGAPAVAAAPAPVPPALSHPGAGSPTIISAKDVGGSGGVSLYGGNAASASPAAGGPSYASSGMPGGPLGNNTGGGIPTRPLRTASPVDSGPPMTRDQANLLIEAERLRPGFPPLPPTELTPLIEAENNGGQLPNNGGGLPLPPSALGLGPPGYKKR